MIVLTKKKIVVDVMHVFRYVPKNVLRCVRIKKDSPILILINIFA